MHIFSNIVYNQTIRYNVKHLLFPVLASKAFFNLSTNAGLLPFVSKPRAPSSVLRSTTFILAGSMFNLKSFSLHYSLITINHNSHINSLNTVITRKNSLSRGERQANQYGGFAITTDYVALRLAFMHR